MSPRDLHDWDLTPKEAVAAQRELRHLVRIAPLSGHLTTIGGADVSFNKFSETVYAGIVVLRLADLSVIDSSAVRTASRFPYVPGLLSFRETPPVLAAWNQLRVKPDVLVLDGQGLAHPRRFGIACHVGLLLDRPTIGCAKSILVGTPGELEEEAGSTAPLIHRGEVIGVALRTKRRVSPVYISVGHLVDLPSAIELILRATGKYRVPEPTRRAHLLVNEHRRADQSEMTVRINETPEG
jgi:deoxyribonuclease V